MADHGGQQLGGYHLHRWLAEDEVADLYLGEHQYTKVQASIKVFHVLITYELAGRFRDEARALAGFVQEGIARVFDFGVEGDTAFLVMEVLANGTLRDRYPAGTRLSLDELLIYARQVASALTYLHDQGFVHGDLRPEHLWIGQQDTVLIGDFLLPSVERVEARVPSPYHAPEQEQGEVHAASDQFALAAILYEWLSGVLPESFSADASAGSPLQTIFLSDCAPAVSQVIKRALAPNPTRRFPSVQAFIQALEDAAQSADKGISLGDSSASPMSSSAPQPTSTPVSAKPPAPKIAKNPVPIKPNAPVPSTPASQPAPSVAGKDEELPSFRWPDEEDKAPGVSRRPVGSTRQQGTRVGSARKAGPFSIFISILLFCIALIRLVSSCSAHTPSSSYTYHPTYPPPTTTILTHRGHQEGVYAVAWSPDGKEVASGDLGGIFQIWDVETGQLVTRYDSKMLGLTTLAWSPDGTSIAIGGLGSAQIWDVKAGKMLYAFTGGVGDLPRLAWSPNGKYIAITGQNNTVLVLDALTGETLFTYRGHSATVRDVAWSPDSKRVASSSGSDQADDNTVHAWDALTGENALVYTDHTSSWVDSVAWSPDGTAIASGDSFGQIQVWNAATGANIFTVEQHQNAVVSLAWSPDSHYLASASFDHTVRIWDGATGTSIYLYAGHSDNVWAVAWSPDGSRLASASQDKTVQIWHLP